MSYQALLFCPDEKTARVVTQVLTELEFAVEPCNEPFAAVKKLMAQHFDAIVVDCENEQNASLLFKSARNSNSNQNSLSVAVVEGKAGVAKAFRIGANLVLTKPINVEQSKGTLRVARGLLRKAEGSKAPAPASTKTDVPVPAFTPAPASTASIAPKAAFAPSVAPKTSQPPMSMASAAGLETESEVAPAVAAEDAAFLESVHEATPRAASPQPGSPAATKKEYPWQPVSKAAEPMASALRRAAEATGKVASPELPSQRPTIAGSAGLATGEAPSLGTMSSHGSASAPAPAKEHAAAPAITGPRTLTSAKAMAASSAPQVEPPTFATLAVKDHETTAEGGGSSKAGLIIAVVVAACLAGGYFGWTKLHPAASKSTVAAPAAPASQATAPMTNAATGTTPDLNAGATAMPSAAGTVPAELAPNAIQPSTKPSAQVKPQRTDVAPDTVTKVAEAPQAIMVKSSPSTAHNSQIAPPSQDTAAPPMIGVGSGDTTQIAGLVSSSPVSVPKAPVQTLRVSQGVSQGLLVKRVQPSYPPAAQQMRLQGAVLLEANIGKDGLVTNVKVVKGDPVLAHAAASAVKQWKYKPYLLDGEPVSIQTEITVNFKLP